MQTADDLHSWIFLQKLYTIDIVKEHCGIRVPRYFLRQYIIVAHLAYPIQPFGHNRHGPKMGRCRAVFGGGELGPHLTTSPGPKPTSAPSGILIHPALWSQSMWAKNWGMLCTFSWGIGWTAGSRI